MSNEIVTCAVCGLPLGAYEPLKVVDEHGRAFVTSLLREEAEGGAPQASRLLLHADCYGRASGADAA